MKRLVVLTGAGISAESGLKTFRGSDGLWEGHNILEVASPGGFARNPELVLRFYNERRAQARLAQPNAGHYALAELEAHFEVQIITQNIDDLHEKAGSAHILHLHGEINKMRSVTDSSYIVDVEGDINLGDTAPDGGQLRPHIVWFGEEVPLITKAVKLMAGADIVAVIGTSLVVYPAAGLLEVAPPYAPVFVVDPHKPPISGARNIHYIQERGSIGVPILATLLKEKFL
ncbi:MAG: NAD-dependent deacylase [Bacteroidia bacterium]|nr:NAD-dependent deacylase [Bacteroidia bacterium]